MTGGRARGPVPSVLSATATITANRGVDYGIHQIRNADREDKSQCTETCEPTSISLALASPGYRLGEPLARPPHADRGNRVSPNPTSPTRRRRTLKAKTSVVTDQVVNSYWFVPAMMTAGSVLLSVLSLWLDDQIREDVPSWLQPLVFSGGPDGAREVLSVIAGSMITVAGVVFSITIVALTLASSQFGPRLLANFMSDRGNQVTLGTFVATFLYSLLVLRTVRTGEFERVPHLSVAVAMLLAIAGLSVLIYFIHHISVMIQAPSLIASISDEMRDTTGRLFPQVGGLFDAGYAAPGSTLPDGFDQEAVLVEASSSGYVEAVDVEGLLVLATQRDLVIRLDVQPGRFLVAGDPVAHAWPAQALDHEASDRIARSVAVGSRATATQDFEFPLKQLSEIAVRSLSPGINDPYTATSCVDHLSITLCDLATQEFPARGIADADGRLRIRLGDPLDFGQLVDAAFDQIRQNAAHHTVVYVHVLHALRNVVDRVRTLDRVQPLTDVASLVLEQSRGALGAQADADEVTAAHVAFTDAARRRLLSLATGNA